MKIKYHKGGGGDNKIADFIYNIKDKSSGQVIVNKIRRLKDIGHYKLQLSNEFEKIKIKKNL